jgi:xylulokinase
VLGVPIERMVVEGGSAFGAALLGGVASGVFSDVDDAVGRTVRTLDAVEPEPAWVDAYTELHARYRRLYPALRALDDAKVER